MNIPTKLLTCHPRRRPALPGRARPPWPRARPKPAENAETEKPDASRSPASEDDIDLVFDDEGNLLPKHFNQRTQEAIEKGMQFLARNQSSDGSFRNTKDGASLPGDDDLAGGDGDARRREHDQPRALCRERQEGGPLRPQAQADPNTGIIAAGTENGRTMYPHGFAMLFLSSAYGMESDEGVRASMKTVIEKGIKLIASAQSPMGGWYYTPNSGDEGSVTVTQLQALRAAHNAGFIVPEDVIEKAIQYLELCRTPDGGIRYSYNSGNSDPPADLRRRAALHVLDRRLRVGDGRGLPRVRLSRAYCLDGNNSSWSKRGGHDYYGHYYAAQAFYQAGDEYWDTYFPAARDQLLNMQGQGGEGAWNGDHVGPVYGTAMALTILQLPYKYLPIYQR